MQQELGENQIQKDPIRTETLIQHETRIEGETRNDGIERLTGETVETGEMGMPNGTTTMITGAREIRIRTCVRSNEIRISAMNELNARQWRSRNSPTRILG